MICIQLFGGFRALLDDGSPLDLWSHLIRSRR